MEAILTAMIILTALFGLGVSIKLISNINEDSE